MRTIEENKYKSLCVSSIYTPILSRVFTSHTFNFIEIHTHCGHKAISYCTYIQLKNASFLRRLKHFICLFFDLRIYHVSYANGYASSFNIFIMLFRCCYIQLRAVFVSIVTKVKIRTVLTYLTVFIVHND